MSLVVKLQFATVVSYEENLGIAGNQKTEKGLPCRYTELGAQRVYKA